MAHFNRARFPRSSVKRLILLVAATCGCYTAFWLRDMSEALNRARPWTRIGSWHFPVSVALMCASLLLGLSEVLYHQTPGFHWVARIAISANFTLLIVWTFEVRNRLNGILRSTRRSPFWLHGLWTALFGAFYIQKQLNAFRATQDQVRERARLVPAH